MIITDVPLIPNRTPNLAELSEVIEPSSAQELADLLSSCADEGRPVVPVGGGQALALGNATSAAAIGVSTRRLNQVIDYQPTDMTLSVGAGATLSEVSVVLAERGQMLPIEAPYPPTATIGGLLATALSGPRRYGGGSLRDVIIGITVAYADGTVGKAGGLVVKNVSGFDMMRIHYGALGTLGVITSANFKVLPIPRSEFTVIHAFPTLGAAADVLSRLRPPSLRPVALTLALENEQWSLAARFEGRGSGLGALMSAISEFLDTSTRFEDRDSAAWWQKLMDGRAFGDENEVRLQLRTQPTDIVSHVAKALDCIGCSGAQLTRTEIEPGLGMATISWSHSEGATEATIHSLRQALPTTSVTIMTAPDRVKATQDVWGQEPESIELMRRLKREFDPHRVLNPGRFAGMI